MDFQQFKSSLKYDTPPSDLSPLLVSLWYDKKGNWNKAHDIADNISGSEAAWVHAYLHRKEGDQWNANYWYRRAGKSIPEISLSEEWEYIVSSLL